ncbi:MAG: MerR family transcriptional regulator [Rubrobacteraceae bacterium]
MGSIEEKLRAIGEVAKISGVPVKTIRYYSDIGLLPPAEVSEARYRLYGEEEIWRLGLIRTLRHLDFSLEEIRKMLSGHLSVTGAITLQLDALDAQVRHLERVRAVLQQAEKSAGDPGRSLEHLHSIGEALSVEAEDRNRFLAEKLRAAIVTEDAPESWRKQAAFLRGIGLRLPEELAPDQAAAWIELVELVNDPEFTAETRRQVAPFWKTLREREVDPDWWQERMEDISQRALAAIDRGEQPDSPGVQDIVDDWISLFAGMMGEEPSADFVRRFAGEVPGWLENDRNRKIQELLIRLDQYGEIPPYEKVNRLMLAGLRWKAARGPEVDLQPAASKSR